MASATFTLRAVDATRAAFASVQNSLQRLENNTKGLAKITKLAFGGEAVLGALNMMKQRLDKVAVSGEDMGFSDEQIASAIRMEQAVEGVLNFLTKIPIMLAQVGINIGNVLDPAKMKSAADVIRDFKFDRSKKEIESITEETRKLQVEMSRVNLTEKQLADTLLQDATKGFQEAVKAFERDPEKGFRLQKDALAILLERERLLKQISKSEDEVEQKYIEANKAFLDANQALNLSRGATIDKEKLLVTLKKQQAMYEADLRNLSALPVKNKQEETRVMNNLAGIYREIAEIEKERRALAVDIGGAISQSFEDAIFAAEKLRDVVRALAQDLLRMIFREQVTKPLAGGLGNFFANLFTGRASGGPVAGGSPYLVGEKGPELFVPSASGSIIPNNRLAGGGAGGAGGVNITYNIAAGVSRADLVPILETERRRLKAEIPDMVRRGGSYRAAFA
jgi:hypothetical protein